MAKTIVVPRYKWLFFNYIGAVSFHEHFGGSIKTSVWFRSGLRLFRQIIAANATHYTISGIGIFLSICCLRFGLRRRRSCCSAVLRRGRGGWNRCRPRIVVNAENSL